MEDIFEILFGLIETFLDSSFDSRTHKKRRKLLITTALIGLPLFVLMLIIGIVDKEPDLVLASVVLLVALVIWLVVKIRTYRKKS